MKNQVSCYFEPHFCGLFCFVGTFALFCELSFSTEKRSDAKNKPLAV